MTVLKIRRENLDGEMDFWLEDTGGCIRWMAGAPGHKGWCVAEITDEGLSVTGGIAPSVERPFHLPLHGHYIVASLGD